MADEDLRDLVQREVKLAVLEARLSDLKADVTAGEKQARSELDKVYVRIDERDARTNDRLEWITRYLLGVAAMAVINVLGTVLLLLAKGHP